MNCTRPVQSVSTIICWCKIWWRNLRPILFGTGWLCYKVDNVLFVFLEWKLKCGTRSGYVKCPSARTSLSTAIPTTHSPGMHMSSWGTLGKVYACLQVYSYPHNTLTWHAHHHGGHQVKYIPVVLPLAAVLSLVSSLNSVLQHGQFLFWPVFRGGLDASLNLGSICWRLENHNLLLYTPFPSSFMQMNFHQDHPFDKTSYSILD